MCSFGDGRGLGALEHDHPLEDQGIRVLERIVSKEPAPV